MSPISASSIGKYAKAEIALRRFENYVQTRRGVKKNVIRNMFKGVLTTFHNAGFEMFGPRSTDKDFHKTLVLKLFTAYERHGYKHGKYNPRGIINNKVPSVDFVPNTALSSNNRVIPAGKRFYPIHRPD